MAENLKSQTVRGVWWSLLDRYSIQGVSFLVTLVMSRILTPGEYGLIGMLAIFIALAQVFIDGGFANALIRKENRTETDFSTVFWVNLGIGLLSYLILFVSAHAIASIYKEEILVPIVRVYALNLVFSSLGAINKVKLTIDINFKTQLKISLISGVTSGVSGILCAVNGMGVWAIVAQSNVSAVLTTLLSFYYIRWRPSLAFSVESFKSLFSYGSKLLAAQTISTLYVYLYHLVIGMKYTKDQLGLYTKATQFGQIVTTTMASSMTRVSFPVLSRVQNDDTKLIDSHRKFIGMVAFIVFPLSLGLCGIARPLISALITDNWLGCVPFLRVITFAYVCDGITIVNLNLLYVKGKSNIVLRLEVIKKSIAIILLLIALPYGVMTICYSQLLYAFIALILNTVNTKKLLNYGFFSQMRDLTPYMLFSLIVMGLALWFDQIIGNNWLVLAASLTACPVVYILLCRLFRLDAMFEMAAIIGSNTLCPAWLNRIITRYFTQK